jgi:UDP-N-acetylglucosamine 2-epimerase (non-hydrolysing)
MKKLLTIIGTRPEIIKMATLIPELDRAFEHVLVDSGQHYSARMHAIFFEELKLRSPDYSLKVGSHRPAKQVALILERFEEVLLNVRPAAVVVQGDTNTALAGALAASKHRDTGVRIIHIEAGARSFIRDQPEEINRKLVDQMSDLLFASCEEDLDNLKREGIDGGRIRVVGNTIVDGCRRIAATLDGTPEAGRYGLEPGSYVFATFHRQETVDDESRLRAVCEALGEISSRIPVIVALHPRTRKMLEQRQATLEGPGLHVIEPLGYRSAVSLLKDSRLCMTDSGGVQEEAAVLSIPTLVLRESTEHIRYVKAGMHVVVGTDRSRIVNEASFLLGNQKEYDRRKNSRISFVENTTARIVREIESFLARPDAL